MGNTDLPVAAAVEETDPARHERRKDNMLNRILVWLYATDTGTSKCFKALEHYRLQLLYDVLTCVLKLQETKK